MKMTFLLLLLGACAQCAPHINPATVSVPVTVSCKTEDIAEPHWNLAQLPRNADSLDRLKAALADLDLSKGYIEELHAQLDACS
jgi:hypothetical protein